MKIAILSSHVLWPQHYETELELMQKHLDAGDEVVQLVCNRSFGICDTNHEHSISKCLACISKREFGTGLLKGKVRTLDLLSFTEAKDFEKAKDLKDDFTSLFSLQEYHIDQYPIGYAVGSTMVSILRDSKLDVKGNKSKISSLIRYSFLAYMAAQKFIREEKPDRIYIFNGRLPIPRAMLSACKKLETDCFIHERGYNFKHYELFKNNLPQDLIFIQQLIEEKWSEASEPDRSQIGADFFTMRRKGKEQGWFSFIKGQQDGLIPSDWDTTKHNIVIFNSSEDEFVSCTDDWKNKLYMSQYDAIKRICRDLADEPDIRIYLRCHPNLQGASDVEKKELEKMKLESLYYIAPDSEISTYALLDNASAVLTFNSTIGIEATFWGKPSILAGPSLFDRLGSNYIPTTHEEVLEMLKKRDLEPMPREGALKYGYYYNSFGIPYEYYQPENLITGTFHGKYITPFPKWNLLKLEQQILSIRSFKFLHHLLHRYHLSKIRNK